MPNKLWLIAGITISALIAACDPETDEPPPGHSVGIERIEMRLDLEWPYKIDRIGSYLDGGSIGGALQDGKNQQLLFSWDGGMRLPPETAALLGKRHGKSAPVDSGPRLAYLGADYPTRDGSRPLPVSSPEESALVDLLRLAAIRSFPLADQDSLVAIRMDLSPSSAWHDMWPRLSEAQRNDLEAIRLATILEAQRAGKAIPRWH